MLSKAHLVIFLLFAAARAEPEIFFAEDANPDGTQNSVDPLIVFPNTTAEAAIFASRLEEIIIEGFEDFPVMTEPEAFNVSFGNITATLVGGFVTDNIING